MAKNVRIDSLVVEGFRAFDLLKIDKLSAVNLIVGKNNVGKTSILEALRLYFSRGDREKISDLLVSRDEYFFGSAKYASMRDERFLAFESLFFGRPRLVEAQEPQAMAPRFRIGPGYQIGAAFPDLEVRFTWLKETVQEIDNSVRLKAIDSFEGGDPVGVMPGFDIRFADRHLLMPMARMDRGGYTSTRKALSRDVVEYPVVYLPSTGLATEQIGQIWDAIALTEDEDEVISALRMLSSSIEKLVLVLPPSSRGRDRVLMVKTSEFKEPVPFKSLGEGINHLLGVFLALIRARRGVILIDEVENGVHYSVQSSLWELIFRQAAAWDIQVFATTHSWDCVEGFHAAASKQNELSASLLRLEGGSGRIRAVSFSPEEIDVARRESIEVR